MSCDIDKSNNDDQKSPNHTFNDSFETKNSNIFESAKTLQHDLNDVSYKLNTFFNELNSSKQNGDHKQPNVNSKNINTNTIWPSNGSFTMTTKMYTKSAQGSGLPDRIFIRRNSLLTELFKIDHIRTIRNIFISIMTVLALQVLLNELIENGKIDLHVQIFTWCFGKISIVFYTWLAMSLSTSIIVYYSFHYWSINRLYYLAKSPKFQLNFKNNKNDANFKLIDKTYDSLWLSLYVAYLFVFVTVPAYINIQNSLPPASSFIVLLEQLRMLMKTHAFVRSNIPRALSNGTKRLADLNKAILENPENELKKIKTSIIDSVVNYDSAHNNNDEEFDDNSKTILEDRLLCPSFTNYLYFLFAPTLVYQDNYPRTRRIRWNYVCTNFAQVIGAVFYTYLIFVRFCIPVFQHFNTEHVTLKMFIQSILNCTLPGTLLLLVAFFAFLHCWLNAFSEMLRFGDRMFYKDWWNSTNFSNYYRTWNVVVHDWLYTYIYKDSYLLLGHKHKTACQFIIFLLSALFHEYALTLAFGFFYPVLFLMFGAAGFACIFLKFERNTMFWNFVTWIGLLIGLGGLMCLYSIEWYARQNCSQSFDSAVIDYLLPRSFTCGMRKTVSDTSSTLSQIKIDL